MKILKWIFVAILYLGLVTCAAVGQTVSPLVAEGGKGKAKGEFTVTNNSVQPLIVSITAMSFKLKADGSSLYYPLENTVGLKMGETSSRIGARQSRTFSYEIQCFSEQPCLVAFLPRMVALQHTAAGVQVGVVIPHSVYLCPGQEKAKGCRERVRKAAGLNR